MIADIFLAFILLFLLLRFLMTKPEKFPPGPQKFPIIGNMYQLRKWGPQMHVAMAEMKRRYGSTVGFFVGEKPYVFVSGLDAIKEICFRDDFSGRPTLLYQKMEKERYGLAFTDGPFWREQRRFTMRHLRDFGFGKRSMEAISIEEVESVFEGLDNMVKDTADDKGWSKPVEVQNILGTATINILWHIVGGKRFSFSDPQLNELLSNVKKYIATIEVLGKMDVVFPNLISLFPFLSDFKMRKDIRDRLSSFIQGAVKKHKETLDADNPRDFIDTYVIETNKRKDEPGNTFSDRQLMQIAFDLFAAGYDTTFNSVMYGLLYMIMNPEVQQKIHDELDAVVGKDRLPSFDDRERIPYTEATLLEMYRSSSIVPLSVPHAPLTTTKDVEFRKFIFPKDTVILLDLYGLHHDPEIWGDPQNFRPDRFLDSNGKVIKHEAHLPFGIGRRACLGESLAKNNIFLFFTCLMHRYCMKVPEGEPLPSNEPVGSATLLPKPFKIQVQRRI